MLTSTFFHKLNFFLVFTFLLHIMPISALAESHDKWIVVTTIQYPTEALKKLASLPGWHLLVVGDKKTGQDWKLENCEFLSVEKQQELNYEILKFLPWNHYCRKNIGYLYAIENGAKFIYETDDDNYLIDEIRLISDAEVKYELSSTNFVANVYAYFGQPSVWPRGYPLNRILSSLQFTLNTPEKVEKIGVVQGLVDKDPDVDAIYRLTQGQEIYFSNRPPCKLSQGIFCPFNTQNTLFNYEAFWGLAIPSTTAFRVCDIWRSYIIQRLFWDLELTVCFTSPTAIQERNAHDNFKDFCDEQDLYLQVNQLITFLLQWESSSVDIENRFEDLIKDLIGKQFLKEKEKDLMSAWIKDLKKVGYQFPRIQSLYSDKNKLSPLHS